MIAVAAAWLLASSLAAATPSHPARPAGSFAWRGVLEGFYGQPWTWAQRRRLVDWLPAHHFNLYAIAPKDDPEIREHWREPLSEDTKRELSALAARAKKRGVALAWTLSPGLDARLDGASDIEAAAGKLISAYGLGVSRLTLAFDDTPPDAAQVAFANAVFDRVRTKCPDAQLTFVPAQYWSDAAPSSYLNAVAKGLDRRVVVGWTGPGILNRGIAAEDSERFRRYIAHPLALGDNYPVQDRLLDTGRVFLGPLTGRDAALASSNDAYLANASPLLEASLVPLATAGDYAWDPAHYDQVSSWRKAIAEAAGRRGEQTLAVLAGLCASSWLEPPHPNETDFLEAAMARYALERQPEPLLARLRTIAALKADALPAALAEELEPWLAKAAEQAKAAITLIGASPRHPVELAWDTAPPIVADQAFDRFFRRARSEPAGMRPLVSEIERFRSGGNNEGSVRVGLDRLIADGQDDPDRELFPWPSILARRAQAARDALDGRPWSAWRLVWLSWQTKLKLLPLLESRRLIEKLLARRESAWGMAERPKPLSLVERAWLAWLRVAAPQSWLARLSSREEAPAAMSELAGVEERRMTRADAEEVLPWEGKVSAYGEAGVAALTLKTPLSPELKASWLRRRESLASGNGLELVLQLDLELDALAKKKKGPISFPVDPADAL